VNNHRLVALSGDTALEETFRAILQQLTGDPVFATAVEAKPSAGWMQRWRKLLGL
jgi:type II secretory pathway component PulK